MGIAAVEDITWETQQNDEATATVARYVANENETLPNKGGAIFAAHLLHKEWRNSYCVERLCGYDKDCLFARQLKSTYVESC